MKTVEMDVYGKLKKELNDARRENEELRERNADLERRLRELHGEYMLLRYQFKGLPNPNEFLKMRQEIQSLKKELRNRGWKDLM